MRGQKEKWAPENVQANFSRSAKLYDRAARRGEVVAVPFDRYLLLERIKRGGMAEVYRAKVVGTDGFEKIVAIKRILPHLAANEDFVRMFVDEAKIVSYLTHQNICPVIELGRCEDGLYLVMEYIWGRDLRQILNALGRAGRLMPLFIAAYIAGRVAEGLDYAHRRSGPMGEHLNIVHRDISPQNILISYEGDVKIIDFGIARANQRTTETRVGTFKGKFAYMSPEQARGKELDRRSDIFALGILLHEMITGSRLFASRNDLETLDRVRNCQIPYPTRPFEEVPPQLIAITMKALRADPKKRWQWAGEMQLALDHFLMHSGELATASRLGTWICLNFAEHAAKALVDQERAARARIATSNPPEYEHHSHPPPLVSRPGGLIPEHYLSPQVEDADSVSSTSSVVNEVDYVSQITSDSNSSPCRVLQPNDNDILFFENDAETFQNDLEDCRSETGAKQPIPPQGRERSHPDIRDTAPPHPRPSQSYGEDTGWQHRRTSHTDPTPNTGENSTEGIEISATFDQRNDEEDLVILDNVPTSKPGTENE